MTTVITNEKLLNVVQEAELAIPPLGAPQSEKRFWYQRANKNYDPDAIATQVCSSLFSYLTRFTFTLVGLLT